MGFSGVQVQTVERILDFYNNDVLPVVYDRGSLGASGDLAPLANLFLPLIGEGEVMHKGQRVKGSDILDRFGWKPIKLQSKRGIGSSERNSVHEFKRHKSPYRRLAYGELLRPIRAMSLEAFDGRIEPFWDCIQQVRPHKGQIETGNAFRKILEGSEIIKRESSCARPLLIPSHSASARCCKGCHAPCH